MDSTLSSASLACRCDGFELHPQRQCLCSHFSPGEETECQSPGNLWQNQVSFDLPPGRSGFEFIARSTELEHFASSHEAFCTDLYAGVSEEAPRPLQVCGRIEKEHAFQTKEKFSPVNPYRSLQADRLKLSGTGQWDMAEYLTDILWLPFLEPEVLAHGRSGCLDGPDFSREN